MQQTRIMAGIISGVEFFTNFTNSGQEPMCMDHGILQPFDRVPQIYKDKLYQKMKNNPVAELAMIHMVGEDEDAKLEKFTMCQYGLADGDPDIDDDGNISAPEYVPCPNRGTCEYEGKGCCSIMFKEGVFFTESETRVFKLLMFTNEEIAKRLFISPYTVSTHIQNMQNKTGFNKLELVRWGTIRNII